MDTNLVLNIVLTTEAIVAFLCNLYVLISVIMTKQVNITFSILLLPCIIQSFLLHKIIFITTANLNGFIIKS